MADGNKILKCEICGNVASLIEDKNVPLHCCGQPMAEMKPKGTAEEGNEKHVPVIEVEGSKVTVKVGSIPHPMEEAHHIQLIQLLRDGNVIAGARLHAGDKPEAVFTLENTDNLKARELCNLHGLWMN